MQVLKKFQLWELKLGPFLWPNPTFKGFTSSEEEKMCNLQMKADLSFKPPPKFFKLDTLTNQCKKSTFQLEKSVLYSQKQSQNARTVGFLLDLGAKYISNFLSISHSSAQGL